MRNILILTVLLLVSYQTLSQDTLKIEPMSINGVEGVFAPEPLVRKIAHKLEEGSLTSKELVVCDSVSTVKDSTIATQYRIISNLRDELSLSNDQIEIHKGKESVLNKKIDLYIDDRKKRKRRGWLIGAGGVAIGFIVGIIAK